MSSGKSETREKILKSAWKLLENSQAYDVRMSDIAKEAGVSRQALYLHFPKRLGLLVATTHYIDGVNNVDERLAPSRAATTGLERLNAFIEAWGNYIPSIYGVAKALMIMSERDEDARLAWEERKAAVREGVSAAVVALARDRQLKSEHSVEHATDILCALLSVESFEYLTGSCNWSRELYIAKTRRVAEQMFVKASDTG